MKNIIYNSMKNMKYLGINLTKYMKDLNAYNYKILLRSERRLK